MVLADTGESVVVRNVEDGYAANVEKAEIGALPAPPAEEPQQLQEVATPGAKTVEEVAALLGVGSDRVVKTLLYETDNGTVAVAIRGDREVNEIKLGNLLDAQVLVLASEEAVRAATGAPVGFAGPVGLAESVRLIADSSVRGLSNFVCGANKADAHFTGASWERDATPGEWADLLLAAEGDPSPRGGGALTASRGIEVGHIFKLGTKYSEAMGCNFNTETGEEQSMIMGCYGLGIGRTVAAAIEQNHDEDGIIWPLPLAPFQVLLVALNVQDETVTAAADALYEQLQAAGVEVFYDDRNERPGVKFKDADLIGIPIRVVVGAKSLAEGQIELSTRRTREREMVAKEAAVERVLGLVKSAL
jgi:prolyl-tRNA synthetase